jgi:hypothetical protein
MLPDIANAIRLQIIDDRAAVLTKEIAALPKHIAEIEKKLEAQQKRVDVDRGPGGKPERAQRSGRRYPGAGTENLQAQKSDDGGEE